VKMSRIVVALALFPWFVRQQTNIFNGLMTKVSRELELIDVYGTGLVPSIIPND
jgi:hypothetical protein